MPRRSLRDLTTLQRVLLLLIIAAGVILLFVAEKVTGTLGSLLRELGIVTLGTVMVSLVYEFVLRREHDQQLLQVVETGLIRRAGEYGLTGIERPDFVDMFRRLEAGDALLWLDTYCPDLDNPEVQKALMDAVRRQAVIKMLVIDPNSATAEARAHEIDVSGYRADDFKSDAYHNLRILNGVRQDLEREGVLRSAAQLRLEVRIYDGLPCAPMYVRLRRDQTVEGWTSYFLSLPTYKSAHLYWGHAALADARLSAGPGLGLEAFRIYFENKWDSVLSTAGAR